MDIDAPPGSALCRYKRLVFEYRSDQNDSIDRGAWTLTYSTYEPMTSSRPHIPTPLQGWTNQMHPPPQMQPPLPPPPPPQLPMPYPMYGYMMLPLPFPHQGEYRPCTGHAETTAYSCSCCCCRHAGVGGVHNSGATVVSEADVTSKPMATDDAANVTAGTLPTTAGTMAATHRSGNTTVSRPLTDTLPVPSSSSSSSAAGVTTGQPLWSQHLLRSVGGRHPTQTTTVTYWCTKRWASTV